MFYCSVSSKTLLLLFQPFCFFQPRPFFQKLAHIKVDYDSQVFLRVSKNKTGYILVPCYYSKSKLTLECAKSLYQYAVVKSSNQKDEFNLPKRLNQHQNFCFAFTSKCNLQRCKMRIFFEGVLLVENLQFCSCKVKVSKTGNL